MKIGEKFEEIVKHDYIDDLRSRLYVNWDIGTMGGKMWWNEIGEYEGWRLQQNKITNHMRILNPSDNRKGWGSYEKVAEGIDYVYQRLINDSHI